MAPPEPPRGDPVLTVFVAFLAVMVVAVVGVGVFLYFYFERQIKRRCDVSTEAGTTPGDLEKLGNIMASFASDVDDKFAYYVTDPLGVVSVGASNGVVSFDNKVTPETTVELGRLGVGRLAASSAEVSLSKKVTGRGYANGVAIKDDGVHVMGDKLSLGGNFVFVNDAASSDLLLCKTGAGGAGVVGCKSLYYS